VKISHYVYENINFSIFFGLVAEKENANNKTNNKNTS